jgi:hypothetical protein
MKESGESDVEMSTVEVEQTSDHCPSTAAEIYLQSAITSIDAINTRTTILLDFLEKTLLFFILSALFSNRTKKRSHSEDATFA